MGGSRNLGDYVLLILDLLLTETLPLRRSGLNRIRKKADVLVLVLLAPNRENAEFFPQHRFDAHFKYPKIALNSRSVRKDFNYKK